MLARLLKSLLTIVSMMYKCTLHQRHITTVYMNEQPFMLYPPFKYMVIVGFSVYYAEVNNFDNVNHYPIAMSATGFLKIEYLNSTNFKRRPDNVQGSVTVSLISTLQKMSQLDLI